MSVRRILEQPRVTKPYTEAEWQEILAAGRAVDERLQAGDVRLTMGGEPTFVSIDDRDGAEWNTAAVGPTKRARADELIRRLQRALRAGRPAALRPGQMVPRRAAAALGVRAATGAATACRCGATRRWRRRRQATPAPRWPHAERFVAGPRRAARPRPRAGAAGLRGPRSTSCASETCCRRTSTRPTTSSTTRMERARLAKVFERGLDVATGYVLPIQRWQAQGRPHWRGERWETRRGKLFLVPGNSPVGLPPAAGLAALGAARRARPARHARSTRSRRRAALPARAPVPQPRRHAGGRPRRTGARRAERLGAVRTALRDRAARRPAVHLHAADRERRGLRRAGRRDRGRPRPSWPAGRDRRLPAARRPAPQRDQGDARPRRDRGQRPSVAQLGRAGRDHRGALRGGPAGPARHLQVHARRPPGRHRRRQPRRASAARPRPTARSCAGPTCCASLVAYWQNHPQPRYLFSGLFIGPTSQAPRVDEARDDQLYELEIALAQVPDRDAGAPARPGWSTALPQPPGRRHRQHPPGRDLHRQALLARRPDRPAGPGRVPRLRDAAARRG